MKLYDHNVSVPFNYVEDSNQNGLRQWWLDRQNWLTEHGKGTWHIYRIPQGFTVVLDRQQPSGNHTIGHIILWSFSDAQTAALFKLTWA